MPDGEAIAETVAERVMRASRRAISARGVFRVVLAGGATPQHAYRRLAQMPADWSRWSIYYGDERCVPTGDAQRNSTLADRALLDHVAVPRTHIHPIPAEHGPARGAAEYGATVRNALPFDLVLLGMGEDGHTASLFPGKEIGIGEHSPDVLAVRGAPKPPPERVSLSARRLSQTRRLYFLIRGASKSAAIDAWRRGDAPIPARFVTAEQGVEGFVTEDVFPAPHSSVALK
jgi:6-phosphogluconolactonase